jgi:hypothetical protein
MPGTSASTAASCCLGPENMHGVLVPGIVGFGDSLGISLFLSQEASFFVLDKTVRLNPLSIQLTFSVNSHTRKDSTESTRKNLDCPPVVSTLSVLSSSTRETHGRHKGKPLCLACCSVRFVLAGD